MYLFSDVSLTMIETAGYEKKRRCPRLGAPRHLIDVVALELLERMLNAKSKCLVRKLRGYQDAEVSSKN